MKMNKNLYVIFLKYSDEKKIESFFIKVHTKVIFFKK